MIEATVTATEIQNNFGKYLKIVMSGNEVVITKNGQEVGRFVPKNTAVSYLTDSLIGALKNDGDLETEKEKSMRAKYGFAD